MTDINSLISLNIELEGLLRVLADRPSAEAKVILAEKFNRFSRLIEPFIAEAEHDSVEADPAYVEVKTQEAEEPEVIPEAEAAEKAVAHDPEPEREPEPIPVSKPEPPHRAAHPGALMKSFTLNDKFRFIRDVFGGDEADFTDTVALIEEMSSYKEATDYLVEDLMLDPDDENVADFLDFIARYF